MRFITFYNILYSSKIMKNIDNILFIKKITIRPTKTFYVIKSLYIK